VLRVTIDSNILRGDLSRMQQACEGLAVEIRPTTVTLREHGIRAPVGESAVSESGVYDESRYDSGAVYAESPPVHESIVVGEWRAGMAVPGSAEAATRFEAILGIIGSGSFPKLGDRNNLSAGRRRQLRDAMILEAHARDGRDVLVSDDLKAFGREKRSRLEALCSTSIMTVDEFCKNVAELVNRN
jgi:hypothetical protein